METNYLRDFVVLAETRNFVEAANHLFSSQSTVSKHLRNIESELGVRLFDRTSRKVEITKFGQLLLPYAKQIIELQDKYTADLESNLAADRETLTVGSIRAMAQYDIPQVLGNFKKSRPQSTLRVTPAGSEDLKGMLRQKKCDLAFIRFVEEVENDLVRIPFTIDPMVAVLPVTNPLAKHKTIPLRMLAREDLLLPEEHKALNVLFRNACKKCGFEPNVVLADDKFENLVELVTKGMGVALLMKQLALYVSSPKVVIVEVSPSVISQVSLCYLKGAKLSDAAKHFIVCTRQHIESRVKS
ncbi:MAG: LysR family transcriptional regulator [Chloroflexi bacterium]|nr:LysR family transcriptional regulator [Chloroflexota bacterium]